MPALLRYAVEIVRRGNELVTLRDDLGGPGALVCLTDMRQLRILKAFVELREEQKYVMREVRLSCSQHLESELD